MFNTQGKGASINYVYVYRELTYDFKCTALALAGGIICFIWLSIVGYKKVTRKCPFYLKWKNVFNLSCGVIKRSIVLGFLSILYRSEIVVVSRAKRLTASPIVKIFHI